MSTDQPVVTPTEPDESTQRSDRRAWKDSPTSGGYLGVSVAHHDFVDKARGTLPYADDWAMPGMLHGQVVRSFQPAGRIRGIDVEAARGVPGVVAVLTAADVPNNQLATEASGLGLSVIETPILADGVVRHVGEAVAIVAAETSEAAEEAAELVMVDLDATDPVLTIDRALEDGAPTLHPADGVVGSDASNVLVDWRFARGDVDDAMAGADVVVERTYQTQRVDHAYLEPEAGVGWIDANGVLVLRVSTQVIEHARHIARILDRPQNRVRVIGTYMGGGFGGKEDMTVEPYLALLVDRTRRPVKMVWSRQESLQARAKRHPITMHYRTGATNDGRIVAVDLDVVGDAGAYPSLSPRVLFAAGVVGAGPYRTDHVRVRSRAVMTNTVPCSAFRGFGAMQMTLGYEGQMDALAHELGLSPDEVRRRNFVDKGDLLATGEDLHTAVALPELLDQARARLGAPAEPTGPTRLVGQGLACNIQPYGRAVYFADQASCWMSFEPDGSLVVRAGVPDLGGGQAASLAQIAAEVLGVDIDRVAVHISDTALTPLTGGTFATRQLYMSGNAAQKTALELRARMAPVAADLLATTIDDLSFTAEQVVGPGGVALGLAELVEECERRHVSVSHLGVFDAEGGDFDPATGRGRTYPDFTYGVHACEVEVDTITGRVHLTKYVAGHDVGTALNPMRIEGQIEGGAVQGIGYALAEDCDLADGAPRSMLFADYLVPVANELPDLDAFFLESGEGKGPFGARGIGEPPIGPAAPALASAIEDAIGVRMDRLPFTPWRVLDALAAASRATA